MLFTLIAERYERRSLGTTSNLAFSEWQRIFASPMATAAAIDRVVHHSVILELRPQLPYRRCPAEGSGQEGEPAGIVDARSVEMLEAGHEAVRPPPVRSRTPIPQNLNSLVPHRQQVITMLVAERHHLSSVAVAVRPCIEAHIAGIKQELDDLDQGLRQALRQSPVWREKDDLPRSVPGIGNQISLTLPA